MNHKKTNLSCRLKCTYNIVQIMKLHIHTTEKYMHVKVDVLNINISGVTDINVAKQDKYSFRIKNIQGIVKIINKQCPQRIDAHECNI